MKSKHVLVVFLFSLLISAIFAEGFLIENAEQEVQNRIFVVFTAGIVVFLLLGFFVVGRGVVGRLAESNRKLKETLRENYTSAKLLVQRDRELVATNRILEERNKEFDETAKMLVRRDLELTLSNERLQELDEMKSQFVSIAAHQLRTPLSGIKWALYTLMNEEIGGLNKQQKKFARDAYQVNERLIELIRDLLDMARLEEGRFGFEPVMQDFSSIVTEVIKSLEDSAKRKGLKLVLAMPAKKLPLMYLDKEKISIALGNLAENAIKYTVPGGTVRICVTKKQKGVVIEVKDTGIGIPEAEIPKIFRKFFRGKSAQLYQTNGTGLGLYLTKNIIEQHGGIISVKSKEKKGSTFTFSLPLDSPHNKQRLNS
jgi:signal transduction histidine kinase